MTAIRGRRRAGLSPRLRPIPFSRSARNTDVRFAQSAKRYRFHATECGPRVLNSCRIQDKRLTPE
jgi:hypothetical protein